MVRRDKLHKTPLGKAIAYARNRAVPLGRFLENGRLPVDNGEVERLIKLIVLGRKNWLFLGSDTVGHRSASVYALVLSCYRLGMDPWAYFRDVLPKLGDTRFPSSWRSSPSRGPSSRLSSNRLVDAPSISRPPCHAS